MSDPYGKFTASPFTRRVIVSSARLGWALVLASTMATFSGAFLSGCDQQAPPTQAPPPVEVTAITLEPRTLPLDLTYVAQVQSSHQVEIRARVSGVLEKIAYKEGDLVKEGQILFELDKRPYLAEAEIAKADVELQESELAIAKGELDRIAALTERKASSQKDLDQARGELRKAEARLHQAKAKYEKALLDVSYATLRSPLEGVADQALIREGGYVDANGPSAKLTTLSRLDPVWVTFSVSQNQQESLHQEVVEGRLLVPEEGRYTVDLELINGRRYPHSGVLDYVALAYDNQTGSFLVRAEIPNPESDFQLRPGLFVKAIIKGAQRPDVLAVPQRAVRQGSKGHEVFVVTDQGLAELRPVTVGDWVGQDWIITQGLKAGEQVVVEGIVKLMPGMPVKVVPDAALPEPPSPPSAAG